MSLKSFCSMLYMAYCMHAYRNRPILYEYKSLQDLPERFFEAIWVFTRHHRGAIITACMLMRWIHYKMFKLLTIIRSPMFSSHLSSRQLWLRHLCYRLTLSTKLRSRIRRSIEKRITIEAS